MAEPTKVASPVSSPGSPGDSSTIAHANAEARREVASAPEGLPTSARDAAAADIAALVSPRRRSHSKESITVMSTSSSAALAANRGRGSQGLGLGGNFTDGGPQNFHYHVPTFPGLADSSEKNSGGGSNHERVAGASSGGAGDGGGGIRRGGEGGGGGGSMNAKKHGGGESGGSTSLRSSKKGIDPPEVELPMKMASTEKLARKSRSRLTKLPHRGDTIAATLSGQPSPSHSFKTSRSESGDSSFLLNSSSSSIHSIHQQKRGGDNSKKGRGGKEKSDLHASSKSGPATGSLSREEDSIDGVTNDDSDDDDYPLVTMDPIQSDDEPDPIESDEEPVTDHFDDDESPPRRIPPVSKQSHQQQHRRYGSPIQGKTSKDKQYHQMKLCPSSAPQRPSHRLPPQQLMQFLHAGGGAAGRASSLFGQQGHPGPGAAGDGGGEGVGGILQLPFKTNSGRNPNSNHQQQDHQNQPLPLNQGKQSQHDMQDHHQEPDQSKKMPRRFSDEAIRYLYTDGIDLLSKAANEAREREEVDTLIDGINYLRMSLDSAEFEKGGSDYKQKFRMPPPQHRTSGPEQHSLRKAAPFPSLPPPIPVPQLYFPLSARHNPPPPITSKSDGVGTDSNMTMSNSSELNMSKSVENLQFNSSNTIQQQQQQQQGRVYRPPPPRTQSSYPSGPTTQTRQRPVITAAAAMDYILSASARPPLVHDDATNMNDDDFDEVDEEMEETSKDQVTLDIGKMKYYLNDMLGGVDIEEGASNIAANRGKNTTMMPLQKNMHSFHNSAQNDDSESDHKAEKYDDDFDRSNVSLSIHAEAKFGLSSGQLSKHAEDKHRALTEQLSRSSIFDRSSVTSVDRPDAGNIEDDIEIHHEEQLPPRTMNERLSEYHEESAEEASNGGNEGKSCALGPWSQRPGGTTGVVLDGYSLSDDNGDNVNQTKMKRMTSRTESPSVSVPNSRKDEDSRSAFSDNLLDGVSHGESKKQSLSEELSSEGVNGKSKVLMMKLCSHLLPAGIDAFDHRKDNLLSTQLILNKINLKWDDDDPDEPGYVVHRLTNSELKGVEYAFEKLVSSLERTSAKHVRDGSSDKNFERDLEEAELILDLDETRYKLEAKRSNNASKSNKNDGVESQIKSQENGDIRESVPDFPGIYPSGKGIAGEMECFYLPIITKSQKTGFEPTKDLVLKPGSVFANNYLVQSELGSAAFSTAYRCIDLSSKEDEDGYQDEVCLKVIKNTKDYFDQSLDEIKILQLLKDTGRVKENYIVEMKSFFYHREHLVIVTELLRQNLYEFGKSILESRGSLYFTRLRLSHITRQCLIALKFVHELGLMHCDIKPENILLCSYSRALIKIIDFGSSSFVSDRQSSYIQSRSYRAPEVILGLPYDGKIDIWSLGCVVAEMYTNEVTFQNDSEVSMLSRIEAICGPFPRHVIANGRNSHRIFTDSGLIYEKISPDDKEEESSHGSSDDDTEKTLFRVYQPKMTTIAARLGFNEDLMDQPHLSDDDKNRALFVDFVSKLLTIDPDGRPSAAEALSHPWIKSSLELTEDDIRYNQG
ncbi:hypothetical protein ACHAW5_000811 [Stephanodiscus triporus]|uniref:Protein kinase domain-containing protein n=1 Tax=Stephanodiscus triporus TaxID=2934178 RepID=A0ABD3N7L0_9STRA